MMIVSSNSRLSFWAFSGMLLFIFSVTDAFLSLSPTKCDIHILTLESHKVSRGYASTLKGPCSTRRSRYRFPTRARWRRVLFATDMDDTGSDPSSLEQKAQAASAQSTTKAVVSKRHMLGFAIPALGIFLCNPLLSNIDNAFVGKTVGTLGLAALSPATICTDQMLFFFSFLDRATTGLVSRAYALDKNKQAAREAGAPALSLALFLGIIVTGVYAIWTPRMLVALNVAPSLRASAGTYIYWRGAIVWAALAQNVMLNILLATRDATTPLKIVLGPPP